MPQVSKPSRRDVMRWRAFALCDRRNVAFAPRVKSRAAAIEKRKIAADDRVLKPGDWRAGRLSFDRRNARAKRMSGYCACGIT